MLSQKTIKTIKATAPVLEVHGKTITTHFYKRMFQDHPELLHIFNHANQQQGRQQTALANTVYAAAKHIDQLEQIIPVVKQIAHKHRSLAVKPEHYPIVGKYLLIAMKEVLGDQATDDIMTAWEEAYGVIANVFIEVEAEMYRDAREQEGGWDDFKDFKVVKKQKESACITSFYLKPVDNRVLPSFQPGQYITVQLQIPEETYTFNRQYSLSCAPGNDYYRISVKREADTEPNGKVSNYLHDFIEEDDVLTVSAPAGDFTLNMDEQAPVAFISGGVGLTPMMSMLEALSQHKSTREITFIHAARNEHVHAFQTDTVKLVESLEHAQAFFGYEKPVNTEGNHHFSGYITKDFLQKVIAGNTICYVCGPVPFLKNVIQVLTELGIPKENIRYEFFGPALDLQTISA